MQAEAATATSSRSAVMAALTRAAQATGTDFDYLLGTAMRESSLNPTARAATSSATGLFQFVDQTWLGVVKNYGAKYGLGSYADAIRQGADGRYHAASSADRSAILALRKDPQVASLMEGELAQETRSTLQGTLGRDVCGGELYAAHFLGPDAACRLIRMSDSDPDASAVHAFPAAAQANRKVFFHADGSAKSVREVYDWALHQPDAAAASGSAGGDSLTSMPVALGGDAPDAASLLSSVTSWRPGHGFFSSDTDAASPSSPFLLTPAVMDVLSAMSPVAGRLPAD
ncbi:MAG TPA: hypothetical protein VGB91_05245 [Rhizomicrobium sp.]